MSNNNNQTAKTTKSKKTPRCAPIILKGHERPITCVRYNNEGDLLFTSSKGDRESIKLTVWRTRNGERLGTYHGHIGSIIKIDVDEQTQKVLTGGSDSEVRIFDVEKGSCIRTLLRHNGLNTAQFGIGAQQILTITAKMMNEASSVAVFDTKSSRNDPVYQFTPLNDNIKVTCGAWGPLDRTILVACEDGTLRNFDVRNPKQPLNVIAAHNKMITDINVVRDGLFLLTTSKDGNAKLWDLEELKLMKTYTTGRPINSGDVSPVKDEIVTVGGQEAVEVTTTRMESTQFRAKFFHMIYTDYIGIFGAGHFSPVNCCRYSPTGKSFATGGEDGYVRLHHFDQAYFDHWGQDMYQSFNI